MTEEEDLSYLLDDCVEDVETKYALYGCLITKEQNDMLVTLVKQYGNCISVTRDILNDQVVAEFKTIGTVRIDPRGVAVDDTI